MDRYQFHFSAVREVQPFRVVERARRMPRDIFPFFHASRVLMLGVDATGMQGLDSDRDAYPLHQSQYGSEPASDDLLIFHSAMKSNHATLPSDTLLRMPLGWISYALRIGKRTFDAEAIAAAAKDWEREFDLQRGTLRTRYRLAGVRVEIESWIVPGTVQPAFRFRFAGGGAVTLRADLHLTLRTGEPLFTDLPAPRPTRDGVTATGDVRSAGMLKVLEPYRICVGISGGRPVAAPEGLGVEREGGGLIGFHFGAQHTGTLEPRRPRAMGATLRRYWREQATVSTGDPRRDWLYHFSQYLCDFGTDMRYGAGCSGNFMPLHLGDRTFWDAHYIADGLLHTGGLAQAEALVAWLHRVIGRDGKRPFNWMVHYDGTCEAPDNAHTCIAAHAMTAAKVGLYTRSPATRRKCRDIVQIVARYAVEHFFRETDRGWIMAAPATTDVTFSKAFEDKARNNTFTHCWFLSILHQAVAWGADEPHLETCRKILANYYLEQNAHEYLDQGDGRGGERTDSYLPILCYPTEGHRWVDRRKYFMTRLRHEHAWVTPVVESFQMPWPGLWGAAGDLRLGLADAAEQRILRALECTYGPGYFAEGNSEGYIGCTQPYLSTCGAFLTAQTEQCFYVDFFGGRVGIFNNLARMHELRPLQFARMRGPHGLVASGTYAPHAVSVALAGRGVFTLDIGIPYALRGGPLSVTVNGRPAAWEPVLAYEEFLGAEDEWRPMLRPQRNLRLRDLKLTGHTRIVVRAGRQRPFDPRHVLALDWLGLGAQLDAAADGGWWLTNRVPRFWSELPRARCAVYTDGVSPLSPRQLETLEAWVRGGGRLIVFFEAGMWPLTGLQLRHAAGHRWEIETHARTLARTPAAPAHLPEQAPFVDAVRFAGAAAEDVDVWFRDEAGAPYCARRRLGAGAVLWIASGRTYLTRREFLESNPWRAWFAAATQSFWTESCS